MKDFNFFEPYIESDFKISKQFILNLVIIASIFSLVAYGVFNQAKIKKLRAENDSKKSIAESPDILSRVEKIRKEEEELKQFSEEVENIKKLNEYIKLTDIVNTSFFSSITSKMPDDMFLTRFDITNNNISLSGISEDKLVVAQFKKGLESIEKFEDIYISQINREEDYYLFQVDILLKEVELDGNNENEEDEITN